jgi:predicted Zn finger-like uncharacterized protein
MAQATPTRLPRQRPEDLVRSTCPSCHSAYDIPDALLGGGRRVRCAACGQTWTVAPPAPAPEAPRERPDPDLKWAEPLVRAEPSPSQLRMQPLAPPDEHPSRWAAWAATFLVIGLAGAGAVLWRDQIMQVWPPSARAYQAVGLVPPPATAARVNGGSGASP